MRIESPMLAEGYSLEISVADVETMTVVNAVNDLLEVSQCLGGGKLASRDQIIKELSSFDVFQNEIPVR